MRVLRTFGPTSKDIAEEWTKLHNEELYNCKKIVPVL
jgi:hypothetical protein